MELGDEIGSGKTKTVYAHPLLSYLAILYFTDNITAGDGVKKDTILGKGEIDWRTNKNIFEGCLIPRGVPTHYRFSPEVRYTIVERLWPKDRVPLEVVGRRVATGSYLKRHPDIEEGTYFPQIVEEFFYKNDVLHDPMLDNAHLEVLTSEKKTGVYRKSKNLLRITFLALEAQLAKLGHQLIDLKIEVGYFGNPPKLKVVDEITAGSLRVWPFADGVNKLDTSQSNVLLQLNKAGMLDKQTYRNGKSLESVKEGFELFAELTDKFER